MNERQGEDEFFADRPRPPLEIQPVWYTTHEDGYWWPWKPEFGVVTEGHLEKRDTKFVEINGQPVHSFLFGPFDTDAKRWDCINGMNK